MPNWKYIWYDIEERWERLGFRNWINNNPKIVIGISVASVFIFLLIVIIQLIPNKYPIVIQTDKVWFYDLNTGKLFVGDRDEIPPIQAPSGKLPDGQLAGVKAYVFSYVHDPNDSERFVGYLEKYTPEGKEIVSSFQRSTRNVTKKLVRKLNKNRFIRKVIDEQWFLAGSEQGRAILREVAHVNETGQTLNYCSPK